MEPQHHATSSSALRAVIGAAPITARAAVRVASRVALRVASLAVLVVIAALVVGCGTSEVTTTPSAPAASASPSASPSSALPVYDESIGGLYQVAAVELEPGDDTVRVVMVAPAAAAHPLVRLRPRAGAVDIVLTDTRPLPAVVHTYPGGDGPILRGRFVFPPDDATVYFRLRLAGGATDDATSMVWEDLSPAVTRLAVTVSH